MSKIRLGIIGQSEGNGHPYSWAAICNGYSKAHMDLCGFPVIPKYLENQVFPRDQLNEAVVTHVWSQDNEISQRISLAAKIPVIVEHYTDMIGSIDGVLLARDDAETHLEFALPFLRAGLPIYIDKPLAYTSSEAEAILSRGQFEGQIFSCSALKYAKEFNIDASALVGDIFAVNAKVMKSWGKYAIHVIDPILNFVDNDIVYSQVCANEVLTSVNYQTAKNQRVNIISSHTNDFPLEIEIFGRDGYRKLVFSDTFFAFRESLCAFIESIKYNKPARTKEDMLSSIRWLEKGLVSCYA